MRAFIALISVASLAAMVTSSWIDIEDELIANSPSRRESSPASFQYRKYIDGNRSVGSVPDAPLERQQRSSRPPHRPARPHHRRRRSAPRISALEMQVTKGEYVCGDRICKLTPGEVPKNCPHGMCQYPILPPAPHRS